MSLSIAVLLKRQRARRGVEHRKYAGWKAVISVAVLYAMDRILMFVFVFVKRSVWKILWKLAE